MAATDRADIIGPDRLTARWGAPGMRSDPARLAPTGLQNPAVREKQP